MDISNSLSNYLNKNQIDYGVVHHRPSSRSYQSSRLAHVDANKLAKAILLKRGEDYLIAVLPASRRLNMRSIREEFGDQTEMAREAELAHCFPDCELGALPPFGEIYGYKNIVDKQLLSQPNIYFEAGNHQDLIKVSEKDFENMLAKARFSEISKDWE
jgi:Ala-tRNA(Pro) deacylase